MVKDSESRQGTTRKALVPNAVWQPRAAGTGALRQSPQPEGGSRLARLIDWTQEKCSEYSVLLTLTGIVALGTWPFVFHWLWSGQESAALPQAEAASDPSLNATPQAGSGEEEEEDAEETSGDPALAVLKQIRTGSFREREEVASGRFLASFEHLAPLLEGLDEMAALPRGRGVNWTQLDVPLVPRRPQDRSGRRAELRLVKVEGAWKLEHLEALPEEVER